MYRETKIELPTNKTREKILIIFFKEYNSINILKTSGNYTYHSVYHSFAISRFVNFIVTIIIIIIIIIIK